MTESPLRTTAEADRPAAVMVGVQLQGVSDAALASSFTELERLARTLGLRVVGRVSQKRKGLGAANLLGAGKLKELAAYTKGPGSADDADAADADRTSSDDEDFEEEAEPEASDDADSPRERAVTVIVDQDLSPTQIRNLERATGAEVLDRSMLILSIFQRHARTREAKIQVEIARLNYLAPRLRETNAGHERQRGGVGGKGAGESGLELDRRANRDRIAELKRTLVIVQREADTQRSRRVSGSVQAIALVGYTNAGKSRLMRALTGDRMYVADQLFATLDTTVRILIPETRPRILVSDTVGFIKDLPHDLVASFRSTLDEARDADLLLHVVDAADPAFHEQLDVTRKVLAEIGAGEHPRLLVLNKSDLLTEAARAALHVDFPDGVVMSAGSASDVAALHARIQAFFERGMEEASFVIPYDQQAQVARLHERCRVLDEAYEEDGAHLRVRAPAALLEQMRREIEAARAVRRADDAAG